MNLNKIMTGPRIILRPTNTDDAAAIYDYTKKYSNEFLKWENSVWRSAEEIREFVSKQKSVAHFVICLDNIIIGTINVWDFSEYRMACQLGWGLNPEYTGHGYMTEAINLLIPELWKNGIVRIKIETLSDNTKSVNLAKRCGFLLEGTLKKDVFIKSRGKFGDTATLAMVNDENAGKLEKERDFIFNNIAINNTK
jgi:RimJ/RimL family protein N-acetyltransferase